MSYLALQQAAYDGESGLDECRASMEGSLYGEERPQEVVITVPQPDDLGHEEAFLNAIDETIREFHDGDLVEGTVVRVDQEEVLVDIGYRSEGVLPARELSIKPVAHPSEVVSVGDHIEALVLTKEDKDGRLILSKKRADAERAWQSIEKIKEDDGVVRGPVVEIVKGGLILDVGLRGFLPASLVEMRRVRDLRPYLGRELEAKVIELDKARNNVILSRRAWLEQSQSDVRSDFLHKIRKGQVRRGIVSSIVNFGAFVDLGGVDGLVHISELSWTPIGHPSEAVAVGQEVEVEVLDIDFDRDRVSLSLKAAQEDPLRHFARTHAINQIAGGRITKLVPFGAFVRLDDGVEGLVHVSELADQHIEVPEQVVQVGAEILTKILDIDLERRRVSLSLKQADAEYREGDEFFDPTLYGMEAAYDNEGNYIYPEGFDPESGEWLEGFDEQRETWENQYAQARELWEAHGRQVQARREAEPLPPPPVRPVTERRSERQGDRRGERQADRRTERRSESPAPAAQSVDEALQALRDKLAGGRDQA
ncbi:30S ribosomal protein S1 [Actinoplanes sp. NBC_00393]|uniref:30S ribosomal protein S1 n=1 Tax=Actinoplanes sp. NBC_00393 TaxID=2975953 RepID=UPI002E217713